MAKRKYTYVWVSLVVLVFGILFVPLIVERIRSGTIVQNDRLSAGVVKEPLSYLVLGGKRRKVPPFAFYDQDSMLITNADYRNKVYVVEFFFTSCPSICPLMTRNLVHLQDTFGDSDNFGIASFSINPRYDTPEVLKEYAEKYGITDIDWHLMTGERDSIYQLANAGFNIYAAEAPDVPGGFEHSGLFALVDKDGYLRSRKDKFGNPIIYYRGAIPEEQGTDSQGDTEQIGILREDIRKLLKE